ncbi:MAG: hypothetical protein IJI14_12245 [Anaerolineaceae bacterium]|nr:hypothetical protein [Anaerolineaceae bacterium]
MAFDTRHFDTHGFDVSGGMVRYVKAKGIENVSAQIGSSLNYHILAIGYERITVPILTGIQGRAVTASGVETVSELIEDGNLFINPKPKFTETISADISLGAEIAILIDMAEQIRGRNNLGADIALAVDLTESVDNYAVLGADIAVADLEGFELVSAQTTAESIETKTCVLKITLKPGERLIIDANNYNVLLNGENAIYVQSGDWIDELIRNTTAIEITAASGGSNLAASILYTERFL